MSSSSRLIVVFLKWPEPGFVKTRIARTTGNERAAQIYRLLVHRVLRNLPDTPIRIAFTPPEKEASVREWISPMLPNATYEAQSPGDLGDRLKQAVGNAFKDEFKHVAVIGTDCVDLDPPLFEACWAALETQDCVFGPTHDGGYYLVGLSAPAPELFTQIPWSSENTLKVSLVAASKANKSTYLLPRHNDIDHYEDWENISPQ